MPSRVANHDSAVRHETGWRPSRLFLSRAAPNCCKRLTKRRLFARAAVAALGRSALEGGALSARPFSKRRTKRAAVFVAVFSRFAIYANVVRPTKGTAAILSNNKAIACWLL